MGESTKIEWCDHTFNPWIGCQRVSPGCENCYAEVGTYTRVQRSKGRELWGPKGERHLTSESNWRKPLKWNREAIAAGVRRRVFCASMADVFEDRADLKPHRERLWSLIESTPGLDWLILTKRPENAERLKPAAFWWPNIWLGTTVEDQRRANERLPHLLATQAAVRFVSYEPALGPVDFERIGDDGELGVEYDALRGGMAGSATMDAGGPRLDWVIVGGESGSGARPFDITWARSAIEQCKTAGVAVFCKQLGSNPVHGHTSRWIENGRTAEVYGAVSPEPGEIKDRKGGDWSEWPADLRVRQWPEARS